MMTWSKAKDSNKGCEQGQMDTRLRQRKSHMRKEKMKIDSFGQVQNDNITEFHVSSFQMQLNVNSYNNIARMINYSISSLDESSIISFE